MRGTTWSTVKPILKVLDENFPAKIGTTYIIKPDNFWQKQRTSLGSAKHKFETVLISVDSMAKYVNLSQLTGEIEGGTFPYDHHNWINSRIIIESFMERIAKVFCIMLGMKEELKQVTVANDLAVVNGLIEEHKMMKKKLSEIPIDEVDAEAQQLLAKLSYFMHDTNRQLQLSKQQQQQSTTGGGGGNKFFNPDIECSISRIFQIVNVIHSGRQTLLNLWNLKRIKYDQHLQLLLFQNDSSKMLEWLANNNDIFMRSFFVIGNALADVKDLQEKHGEFASASVSVYMNITKLQQVATNMVEGGHGSMVLINQITAKLDRGWKEFSSIIDQRNLLLSIAAAFYNNCEEYAKQVGSFRTLCDNPNLYSYHLEPPELETLIKKIHSFFEKLYYLYNECHLSSKKLITQLEHLYKNYNVATTSSGSNTSAGDTSYAHQLYRDYSGSLNNVMNLIQNLSGQHQNLDQLWSLKKIKLHQRLALAFFQDDVRQVLDWINDHGNSYLNKNPGIGKSLSKSKMLQKSHIHFETVAQNTYTNAEKLLLAADELARTGECNADEISQVTGSLKITISNFAKRVEHRRNLLNFAVTFFALEKDINSLANEMRKQVRVSPMVLPDTKETIEKVINNFMLQRKSLLNLINTAIGKGQMLVNELKSDTLVHQAGNFGAGGEFGDEGFHSLSTSIATVEGSIERLRSFLPEFEELWKGQQYKNEIGLKIRMFESETLNLTNQLELWVEDVHNSFYHDETLQFHQANGGHIIDPKAYEEVFEAFNTKFAQLHKVLHDSLHYGREVAQLVDGCHFRLLASPDGQTALDLMHKIIDFLQTKEVEIDEVYQMRRRQLEQIIQFGDFQRSADQILAWIRNGEAMLKASFAIPISLATADNLKMVHQQFQEEIEVCWFVFVFPLLLIFFRKNRKLIVVQFTYNNEPIISPTRSTSTRRPSKRFRTSC